MLIDPATITSDQSFALMLLNRIESLEREIDTIKHPPRTYCELSYVIRDKFKRLYEESREQAKADAKREFLKKFPEELRGKFRDDEIDNHGFGLIAVLTFMENNPPPDIDRKGLIDKVHQFFYFGGLADPDVAEWFQCKIDAYIGLDL
jgi:sugar-specific transcriptional regulator TrmB